MRIELDNNVYALSAAPDRRALVTVVEGELEYTSRDRGPFRSEGILETGSQREFTSPTVLAAFATAACELEYPQESGTKD